MSLLNWETFWEITDNYFDLEFSVLLLLVTLGVSIYLLLAGLFGFSNYHVLNPSVWLYSDRVFFLLLFPGTRRNVGAPSITSKPLRKWPPKLHRIMYLPCISNI